MLKRKVLYLKDPKSTQQASSLLPELRSAGWDVHLAKNADEARQMIGTQSFQVGLAQFGPSGDENLLPMEDVLYAGSDLEWIALLPQDGMQNGDVSRLVRENFYDYHTLPADSSRLLWTLGHAYGMATMKQKSGRLQEGCSGEDEMVGNCPAMQTLFSNIRKIASVEAPVLITGESGTGKELTAVAIHQRSRRAHEPFVAVNCAALPLNLIQSELFGHEKGAFTGAHQRKVGRIEAAAGGTIFLDEIGDLPLEMQVNLLRFLQEKTIERVGSTEQIHVDVRVVAATHVDLEKAVAEGRFREDLFYRLNVLYVRVPALRERDGDIELLARYFFNKFASEKRQIAQGFTQQALQMMNAHDWPGNVREMINRIRRAMVMCENRLITPADLGLERRTSKWRQLTLEEARIEAEKSVIQSALQRSRNNISQAANDLGVSRVTLYRLMEKCGLHS